MTQEQGLKIRAMELAVSILRNESMNPQPDAVQKMYETIHNLLKPQESQ